VLELLRPPPHRGPLIAAGAVLLAVGVVLEELRLADKLSLGVHLIILAAAAGVILALGLQAPTEGGKPPAYQSVLLVTGLLLLFPALLRVADVLGADLSESGLPAGELTWISTVVAGVALYAAQRKRSAICLLLAAIAAAIAILSAFQWVFEPDSFTASRWLLLLIALGVVLVSLVLRGGEPRQAELLVDAAGLAILAIGLQALVSFLIGQASPFASGSPDSVLPDFWEFIVLAVGCGLIAYGAIERSPGPAWLGVANLAVFVVSAFAVSDETLNWWPLLLILLGAGAMLAGLRPRQPLPPEPSAYGAGGRPLATRTDEEEVVLRVRDDSPPISR
jgi:lipoprotein signal peptidase